MNINERLWIKENIEQIFIKDVEEDNDMQTEHAMDFLADLAHYVGVSIS